MNVAGPMTRDIRSDLPVPQRGPGHLAIGSRVGIVPLGVLLSYCRVPFKADFLCGLTPNSLAVSTLRATNARVASSVPEERFIHHPASTLYST